MKPTQLHIDIDKILLQNGFKYWPDWEYGPMCGWAEPCDRIILKLFRHDQGYWIIFRRHAGGANETMNIGSSDNATAIVVLRDALKRCGEYKEAHHD